MQNTSHSSMMLRREKMKKDKDDENETISCKKCQGGIRQWQENEEKVERKINGGK